MTEHISFDDLASLAGASAMAPQTQELAARVNAHLLRCPACRATYSALLELTELSANLGGASAPDAFVPAELPGLFWAKLKLAAGRLLLGGVNSDAFDFGYPLALGARDGGGAPRRRDCLVDNENLNNRLQFSDGTLEVRLDAECVTTARPALAVFADGKLLALQELTCGDGVWTASVSGLADGAYDIAVR